MTNLLTALNLAYNTQIKAKERLAIAHSTHLNALPTPCESVLQWHDQSVAWLNNAPNRFYVSILDSHYSPSLLNLPDPPLILFGEGHAELLHAQSIGMVGSRNATQTGLSIARNMAKAFVENGWAVVSGLAEGIDGAAHTGALNGQGPTLAVLGCGLDHVYPKHHATLAKRIGEEGGLLISEYPPGTAPQPGFFPRRNRIIAALSDALLVVEAALRSGSLITARVASTLGRPVFAVPGSIHSPQSRGCHAMIKQGAGLAETVGDVISEAQAGLAPSKHRPEGYRMLQEEDTLCNALHTPSNATHSTFSEFSKKLLKCLSHTPTPVDTLAQKADLSTEDTLATLTELELEGMVLCEAGQRWTRV